MNQMVMKRMFPVINRVTQSLPATHWKHHNFCVLVPHLHYYFEGSPFFYLTSRYGTLDDLHGRYMVPNGQHTVFLAGLALFICQIQALEATPIFLLEPPERLFKMNFQKTETSAEQVSLVRKALRTRSDEDIRAYLRDTTDFTPGDFEAMVDLLSCFGYPVYTVPQNFNSQVSLITKQLPNSSLFCPVPNYFRFGAERISFYALSPLRGFGEATISDILESTGLTFLQFQQLCALARLDSKTRKAFMAEKERMTLMAAMRGTSHDVFKSLAGRLSDDQMEQLKSILAKEKLPSELEFYRIDPEPCMNVDELKVRLMKSVPGIENIRPIFEDIQTKFRTFRSNLFGTASPSRSLDELYNTTEKKPRESLNEKETKDLQSDYFQKKLQSIQRDQSTGGDAGASKQPFSFTSAFKKKPN